MIPTYVVVAAHNRPTVLANCVESLRPVDNVIIIDNASDPPVALKSVVTIRDETQPPNLSALWNLGLDAAQDLATSNGHQEWNVAVVNDDIVAPPGWARGLAKALREHPDVVLAYPDQFGRLHKKPLIHTEPKTTDAFQRIVGYAHMMRGEIGLRYDERFVWWYGDDDMDWQARQAGGSMMVPGLAVEHLYPDMSTNNNPELYSQAGFDRQAFLDKWGELPC